MNAPEHSAEKSALPPPPDLPATEADLQSPADPASTIDEASAIPRPRPQPWRLPPRYQTRGAIARGGMGLVLRVHDVEVDRPLALKLLLDFDPAATARTHRFLDEARITGQLQHPGIPPVHEIGQLDDGRPFFSMKLIAGRTLAELLQQRPSPQSELPRFLHIFEQIAQTVGYAHAQGVIHRDLKPLNIMVGAFGEVQVMDWGLAKRLHEHRTEADAAATVSAPAPAPPDGATVDYRPDGSDERTQAGQVMGTFAYMPPEQARGEVERLDERSDVFGLGAILCQVLTGEPPYRAAVNRDLWQQAREGDLTDALARLRSCGADSELIALAASYLAVEPEDRPRNAGVLAEQIMTHLQSVQQRLQQAERERAVAQARTIEERKRRRWQRALALILLLVILGGSMAGVWYYQDRAQRMAEEARQEGDLAARKSRLDQDVNAALNEAQRVHDELYGELADARAASALLSDMESWHIRVQTERSIWHRAERLAAADPSLLAESAAERLRAAGRQIEEDEADWQLASKSDALRLGEVVVADDYLRDKATGDKLAVFFRKELKLDLDGGDAERVADQIRQSRLRNVVIALLDHWAMIAKEGGRIRRLLAIARLADPDPWRDRVRDPQTWEDRAKLEQLVQETDVSRQPPQILLLLARRLHDRGGNDYALLQLALAEYPRDFWLYETLVRSTTNGTEQIGYLQAALAVRPQSFVIHERLAGVLQSERKDTEAAIRHRRKALRINPQFARAHYNLGAALLHKGDLEGAIRHCQAAMEINSRFAAYAHCLIGNALLQKKDRAGAIAHYEKATPLAGRDSMALDLLGNAWYNVGKWEQAAAAFRELTTVEPKKAAAYSNLALTLHELKKFDEAIAVYHKAIELKPNEAWVHVNLGLALYEQKKFDEAIAAYHKAIEIDPNNVSAHFNEGITRWYQRKLDEAVAAYRKAIALNDRFAAAYYNLGLALHAQKKLDEASAAYRKAIELNPNEAGAHRNLGLALVSQGKLKEAITVLNKAIEIDPRDALAYNQLGVALRTQDKLGEAIIAYRKAIDIYPRYFDAHANLGVALYFQGNLEAAEASCRKAIELNPRDVNPYITLSAVLIRQKNYEEALAVAGKAIALKPDDPRAHVNRGRALQEQKKLDEAIAAYRKAIEFDARHVQANTNLAVVLREQKRFKEASAVQEKLIGLVRPRTVPICRYFAACNAVLAGCGKGVDAGKLDETERRRLRNQALAWLQEEVRLNRQLIQKGTPDSWRMQFFSDWQNDKDLALVREPKELAKLPEAERQAWQRLWTDVKELAEQAPSRDTEPRP